MKMNNKKIWNTILVVSAQRGSPVLRTRKEESEYFLKNNQDLKKKEREKKDIPWLPDVFVDTHEQPSYISLKSPEQEQDNKGNDHTSNNDASDYTARKR